MDLKGKVVIVTGCNTGIGKETAKQLAADGAKVIMACRSKERTEPSRDEIISQTNNSDVYFMQLDLSSLESVRNFAAEFNSTYDRLDILVNNAGVNTAEKRLTKDGHEMMFGTNHLGHFLLTNLLLDKLKASAPSRVVTVSSLGHEKNPINLDDLDSEKRFDFMKTYGQSKSANVLFTVQLAKLTQGTGVTAYSLHPGSILTELARDHSFSKWCCFPCLLSMVVRLIFCQSMKTIEEGAATTLYCCLEPSIAEHSGRYYSDSKEKAAKPLATNPETAAALWEKSLEMCGLN